MTDIKDLEIEGHKIAADMDEKLFINMTVDQVIEVMGEPSGRSKYVSTYDGLEDISETLEYNKGNTRIYSSNNLITGWSIDIGSAIMKSRHVKFAATDVEKRLTYGIVMEPEETDSQGEVTSAEEIEKAAHGFMEKSRVMGDSHEKRAKAVPVESYITTQDISIGEQAVKQGSWLMVSRVDDDDLWTGIKEGDYTGYSIGAYVKRRDIDE